MPDSATLALARRCSFWLKEALQGRATSRLLREIEAATRLSPNERRAQQWRRLAGVVRLAVERVPWYTESLCGVDLDRALANPAAFAEHVPILTRDGVRSAGRRLVAPPSPELGRRRILRGTTSGSSGDQIHFCSDAVRATASSAARIHARERLGIRPGDREIRLMGDPWLARSDLRTRLRARLERVAARPAGVLKSCAYSLGPADLDARCDLVARYRPRVLTGYGGALLTLAEHVVRAGRQAAFESVSTVIFASEPVFDSGRDLLSQAFRPDAVVADYVCHEMGMIGHECPEGRLHLNDDFLYVETLDDRGRPHVGGPARLVVTDLAPSRTPFIRYELGDIAALAPPDVRCPCGAPQRTLARFVGRTDDRIRRPDGSYLHPFALDYVVLPLRGVRHWQTRVGPGTTLALRIETSHEALAPYHSDMLVQLRRYAGPTFDCSIEAVDRIEPLPNGKYVRVVREETN